MAQIFHTDNVDTQVNIFNDTFNQCLNTCAPLVTKVVRRPFAPWINNNVKEAMSHRNEIQRKLKQDRLNRTLQEEYRNLKLNVKKYDSNSKERTLQ